MRPQRDGVEFSMTDDLGHEASSDSDKLGV